jgi:hypothetical protein
LHWYYGIIAVFDKVMIISIFAYRPIPMLAIPIAHLIKVEVPLHIGSQQERRPSSTYVGIAP